MGDVMVVRAWPQFPPPGRPRVEDYWPRVQVDNYDYRGLADLEADVIVMDWDTAVDLAEVKGFASRCRGSEQPRVAPCLMYQDGDNDLTEPVWNAKVYEGPHQQSMRYVVEGDPLCDLFGFGLTYLPGKLIAAFMAAWPGKVMDDMSFSGWWYRVSGAQTELDWAVHPVHVHYAVPAGGRL